MSQNLRFLRLIKTKEKCYNKRWYTTSNNNNNNNNNNNTRYTKNHSWISIDGIDSNNSSGGVIKGTMGITENCINEYDDVLYVKFPIINNMEHNEDSGNEMNSHFKIRIETMSDEISLNSPIPGKITSINQEVLDFPNNVTTSGWLCTLNFNNISNFNKLMNKSEYDNYCNNNNNN